MRLGDLGQRQAGQVRIAELQHPGREREAPAERWDVPELASVRRKRRAAARDRPVVQRDVAQGLRLGCVQRADEQQSTLQRLDEVPSRPARGPAHASGDSPIGKQDTLGDRVSGVEAGHTGVDRGVDQHFTDLFRRQPVGPRTRARACRSRCRRASAVRTAKVIQLRVRRSRPSRVQTDPQAKRVMKS